MKYFISILILFALAGQQTFRFVDVSAFLPKKENRIRTRELRNIEIAMLHNSGSDRTNPANMAEYHTGHNNWATIGYHYVISLQGNLFQTNALETIAPHTAGYYQGKEINAISIGICIEGDLDKHPMTKKQHKTLLFLISSLQQKFPGIKFHKHKDFNNTTCPGKYFAL